MFSHECKHDWHEFCEEKGCECQCHPAPDGHREERDQKKPKWWEQLLRWWAIKDM